MKSFLTVLCSVVYLLACNDKVLKTNTPSEMGEEQRVAQIKEMKFGMFICWSFSTFYGQEWTPTLDKNSSYFNVTGYDTN